MDWLDDPKFTADPSKSWRENYEAYLQSERWKRTRGIAIYEAGNRCQRCGFQSDYTGKGLEVHHKTYKHLGNEPLEDLEVLCPDCHKVADQEREVRNKAKQRG